MSSQTVPAMTFELLREVETAPRGRELPLSPVYECAPAPGAGGAGGVRQIDGVHTCHDLWERTCAKHPQRNALAWRERGPDKTYRPYQYMTYGEAHELAARVGSGLASLALSKGDRVGICAVNSPEYMLTLQGINRMGYVAVPLYDTLGDAAVAYVVEHAEARVVLCGASKLAEVAKTAARLAGAAAGALRAVVYWGDAPDGALQAVADAGAQVTSWGDLLEAGKAAPQPAQAPAAEDLCTIMYTSGTTGNPKGVMLAHSAVVTEVAAVRQFFLERAGKKVIEKAAQRYFSFLTLAHIFDRVVEEFLIMEGGCIGYYTGDVRRILEDVAEFRPTAFAGVPRVFERIYAGALGKVKAQPALRRAVFRLALAWKSARIRGGAKPEKASALADALVFNKFKAALGGQCQAIISGGAPLAPRVQEFVQIAMCCPVLQGYGLTETCAASFVTLPWDSKQIGTVGPPMPGIQLRLEAVPELGYSPYNETPQGEICLRGAALFRGYYKEPEMTSDVVDDDGFFHTGDIGEITPRGLLRIIDRKKNIFKLSQGEYVAVEKVEVALARCPLVEQVWVYGNSFRSCLVAVVVPLRERLEEWAAGAGAAGGSFEELCASVAARGAVLEGLLAAGRAAKLKGFELPKAIILEPELFSVDNDLMTPKFSLKRPQLLKRYQQQIDEIYATIKA